MGSQVNFYMVPKDEEDFLRFVISDPEVEVFWSLSLDSPHELVNFPLPHARVPYRGWLACWNRNVATTEEVTPPNRLPDDNHQEGIYHINGMVYPVIEILRSALTDDGLTPGRIWVDFEHLRRDPDREKRFRSWFRRLARWLNKWPYRWDPYRIGPKTKEYFDNGGKAVVYGLGEVKVVEARGDTKIIRRGVKTSTEQPDIEEDSGGSDLTIEM